MVEKDMIDLFQCRCGGSNQEKGAGSRVFARVYGLCQDWDAS